EKALVLQRAALNLVLIDINDVTNDPVLRSLEISPEQIARLRDLAQGTLPQQMFVASKFQIFQDLLIAKTAGVPGSADAYAVATAELVRITKASFIRVQNRRLDAEIAVNAATLEMYRKMGGAIANAYSEFEAKVSDAYEWGASVTRSTLETFIKAFGA